MICNYSEKSISFGQLCLIKCPSDEAVLLKEAMKFFRTNEQEIINILGSKSIQERKDIALAYQRIFNSSLIDQFHSRLSGNFKKSVLLSMCDKAELHAKCIFESTRSFGSAHSMLIQILCMSSNEEIKALNRTYYNLYNIELSSVLDSLTSGDLNIILQKILLEARENSSLSENLSNDFGRIFINKEGKVNVTALIHLLTRRSFESIAELDRIAYISTCQGLLPAIIQSTSGNAKLALTTIVKTALDKIGLIVELLNDSIKGSGTKDNQLIRLILAYAEDEFVPVKKRYFETYRRRLVHDVGQDTSGNYGKFLIEILKSH